MEDNTMETSGAESFDFDAFMDADGGNQTDTDPTVAEEEGAEGADRPAEAENENAHQEEENSADGDSETEEATSAPPETFTIKVNKEEKTLSREEMISFAQKGHDYDRVKQQRDESRQEVQSLREQIGKSQDVLDLLSMVSEQTKQPLMDLAENLYINVQKSKGIDEATAREALRADKAQRQLNAMREQQKQQTAARESNANRAQTEIAEFRQQFPEVTITEELVNKLMPDVQNGMTMVNAYLKAENARKDAENAELRRQLAADKQNKKNRTASPGSQKDSGGQTKKDTFDEFMEAFA